MTYNFALDTDSYKYSHYLQLPQSLRNVSSYAEARSDEVFKKSMVFGLQAWLRKIRANPLTMEQVDYARGVAMRHSGYFPYAEFKRIVEVHKGLPPVSIQALPEGLVVPNRVPLYQVMSTDPLIPWIGQFVETSLLRALWYPSTVATLSWHIKQDLRKWLERTCDSPEAELMFRLHDFCARGASSEETASLGAMAHLVNFMGSDTMGGIEAADKFYDEPLAAGFSIPAMEHFTVCSWGQEFEADAYANMIENFGGEGKVYACVSDAYDLHNAVDNIWGKQLKGQVLEKGGRVVIRPDSGDPVSEVMYTVRSLANSYGYTTNKKGYSVLHPAVRVIQGDGVNRVSINSICTALEINNFSIENVAFGMGGALLQGINRDTLGYAHKASAVTNGLSGWTGIAKNPATARQKVSKKGRQIVYANDMGTITSAVAGSVIAYHNYLEPVYENVMGSDQVLREMTYAQVRANSNL